MMWMMGYDDAVEEYPFTGRKLRPLMPRPATVSTTPPLFSRIHGPAHDLLALNHHLVTAEQMNKRELNAPQQVVVSSRWNPTPEQLQTLEELYRRGTRTPSADQIQQITAQLRRFGKIEGKNVFYWFQNHKARERQKRRRQLESSDLSDQEQQQQPPHNNDDNNNNNNNNDNNNNNNNQAEKREPPQGANRTFFEVEQKGNKNWVSLTNSSTIPEKTRAAKAAEAEAECKSDGWEQFNIDSQSQQRRNATWHLSWTKSPSSTIELIKPPPPPPPTNHDFVNIFLDPYNPHHDAQTLQLFPLRTRYEYDDDDDDDNKNNNNDSSVSTASHNNNVVAPCQFFEFLPLKGS